MFELKTKRITVNGKQREYYYLDHSGSVAILPVKDGKIGIIRQYRPAIGQWIYEIPAGTVDPGEDPESCAFRELEEETSFRAGRLMKLCEFYLAPGYSTELMNLFLALDLTEGSLNLDDTEQIEKVVWVTKEEMTAMAESGEIRDSKTLIGLFYLHFSAECRNALAASKTRGAGGEVE